MPSTPRRDATATAPRPTSTEANLERRGLSIRDAAAWRQQSPFSWVALHWTICAVKVDKRIRFELWQNSGFVCSADDSQTLRNEAAKRSGDS
jgi:hypothetical protein